MINCKDLTTKIILQDGWTRDLCSLVRGVYSRDPSISRGAGRSRSVARSGGFIRTPLLCRSNVVLFSFETVPSMSYPYHFHSRSPKSFMVIDDLVGNFTVHVRV